MKIERNLAVACACLLCGAFLDKSQQMVTRYFGQSTATMLIALCLLLVVLALSTTSIIYSAKSAKRLLRLLRRRACLTVAATLMICTVASAGEWRHLGGSNYTDGRWVYSATYSCGCWNYKKLYPDSASKDFWDDALNWEAKAESDQKKADYLNARYPGRGTGTYYGQSETGVSVLQQGYAPGLVQGGQTLYGLASLPVATPIDATALLHEAQRLTDRTLGLAQYAQAGSQQLVSQAIEGNSKAAQIIASAQVAAAAIQAANPPTTEVKTYQRGPATPPQQQYEQPPPQPQTDQHGSVNYQRAYQIAGLAVCSKCHSGAQAKAGLDLSSMAAIAALPLDRRIELGSEVKRRLALPVNDAQHMPHNGQMLSSTVQDAIVNLFASN